MQAIMMKTKESDDDKPYGKHWKKTRPVNASDIDVPPGYTNFKEAAGRLSFVLTDETREKLLRGKDKPIQPIVKLEPHTAGQGFVFGRKEFGIPENEILLAEFGTLVKYHAQYTAGISCNQSKS
jgi:tRNA C32,U32 (ribose-2'-O)-methylase TrmJ